MTIRTSLAALALPLGLLACADEAYEEGAVVTEQGNVVTEAERDRATDGPSRGADRRA